MGGLVKNERPRHRESENSEAEEKKTGQNRKTEKKGPKCNLLDISSRIERETK